MRWWLPIGLAVLLSGCTGAAVDGQGTFQPGVVDEIRTDCDGKGKLSVELQGTGHIEVRLQDGAGITLRKVVLNGNGIKEENQEHTGAPGLWKVTVEVKSSSMMGGYGFNGIYDVSLRC